MTVLKYSISKYQHFTKLQIYLPFYFNITLTIALTIGTVNKTKSSNDKKEIFMRRDDTRFVT